MSPQPLAAVRSSYAHTPVAGLRLGLRARAFSAQSEPVAACRPGASTARGFRGWAAQKGLSLIARHAFSFGPIRPVQQLVHRCFVSMEAPMEQLELRPLLGRLDGASVVPPSMLKSIRTYREAVRLCWALRRVKGLKPTDLARDFDFTRQHVSDYLNSDDRPTRRDLPPDRIKDFEDICANTAITQWLAARQRLTILEEMQAERNAA